MTEIVMQLFLFSFSVSLLVLLVCFLAESYWVESRKDQLEDLRKEREKLGLKPKRFPLMFFKRFI